MKQRVVQLIAALMCSMPVATAPISVHGQNLPSLGDSDREELSPLMERKLGEQIMRDIRRDPDYLDDPVVSEYLNNFGATLVSAAPEARGEAGYDFYFFAVRDRTLNAFALPGGFIGVHSGLLLAAQNESELAGVVAHEVGHVAQRHIARMLGKQRQDALIPLAATVLAVLAARSSPDASGALLMGGQGLAVQRQLAFSRDAEREADRVGLQILREANYDTSGMIQFFGRMQSATRGYSEAPAYLRSHPVTTERIADIQARTRDQRYKQRPESLDFHLARARVRVLQDLSAQGLRDATTAFENQLKLKTTIQSVAAKYGLAYIALRQGAPDKALSLLREAQEAGDALPAVKDDPILAGLAIEARLAANQPQEALKASEAARAKFPISRALTWQYADALTAAGRYDDAVRFLRDEAQNYREEPQLQEKLAKVYAAQGKQALQHLALADSYALSGGVMMALDQLAIARRSSDASFYDLAMIDARERELKARWREEQEGMKGRK